MPANCISADARFLPNLGIPGSIYLYSFLSYSRGSRYEVIHCPCTDIRAPAYGATVSPDTGLTKVPWVIPRLVIPPYGGIPRRSCDSSQQADRVGSDQDAWVDVRATSPFSCCLVQRGMRHYQELLSRDRYAGAHQRGIRKLSCASPETGETRPR